MDEGMKEEWENLTEAGEGGKTKMELEFDQGDLLAAYSPIPMPLLLLYHHSNSISLHRNSDSSQSVSLSLNFSSSLDLRLFDSFLPSLLPLPKTLIF